MKEKCLREAGEAQSMSQSCNELLMNQIPLRNTNRF